MGLLIIFALVSAFGLFIGFYIAERYILSDFLELGSILIGFVSGFLAVCVLLTIISESYGINHAINQLTYESNTIQCLIDNTDQLTTIDKNTLYLRATDFNKDLRNKHYWGHNFFTIYLCSPRYTEVPLVKFPYEAS